MPYGGLHTIPRTYGSTSVEATCLSCQRSRHHKDELRPEPFRSLQATSGAQPDWRTMSSVQLWQRLVSTGMQCTPA